jgi:hypothetical protein
MPGRRRRDRVGQRRPSTVWAPLLVVAGLLVLAGASTRFYHEHPHAGNTAIALLLVVGAAVLRLRARFRRWWHGIPDRDRGRGDGRR